MISKTLSEKLAFHFHKMYINSSFEAIIFPASNSYFCLDDCETEDDVKAKILEFLSRDAHKETSHQCKSYLIKGINSFLGTNFSESDMCRIYIQLGNRVNHGLTLKFINSVYDMSLLEPLPEHMQGWYKK